MEALKSCLFSAVTNLYRIVFSQETWQKIEAYATFLDYYSKIYAIIWNYIPKFTPLGLSDYRFADCIYDVGNILVADHRARGQTHTHFE